MAAFAAVVCLVWCACCYRDYQDKISILNHVLGQGNADAIDTVMGIMKSEGLDGGALLRQYGYGNNGQNQYFVRFCRHCIGAAASTLLFLFAAITVVWIRDKQGRIGQDAYIRQIAQCLAQFREGNGDCMGVFALERAGEAASLVGSQLEMLSAHLSLAQEQAYEEKEKTKRLVTDISHQLKTPVAALDTCFAVLEGRSLDKAEQEEFYGRCRNELEGLKMLISSLVQISQMEAGMIQVKLEEAFLLDTIIKAVNRIYPKASAKKMELAFHYEPQMERMPVQQDTEWLCEAFINLLDNAIKYSPPGSEVQISIQRLVSVVRIEIEDSGIGIPKQEYHKIFKRFYRGCSRQVRAEQGSGVGLYLAREIINRHHGTIFVKQSHRKALEYPGSIFVVQLPVGY